MIGCFLACHKGQPCKRSAGAAGPRTEQQLYGSLPGRARRPVKGRWGGLFLCAIRADLMLAARAKGSHILLSATYGKSQLASICMAFCVLSKLVRQQLEKFWQALDLVRHFAFSLLKCCQAVSIQSRHK